MSNALRQLRRAHPLLRGLFLLYLAGTLLLVAAHQHHSGLEGHHDCALCAAAHTPAVVGAALDHEIAPASHETLLTVSAEQGWDSESHRTTRSRAPPLA